MKLLRARAIVSFFCSLVSLFFSDRPARDAARIWTLESLPAPLSSSRSSIHFLRHAMPQQTAPLPFTTCSHNPSCVISSMLAWNANSVQNDMRIGPER